MKRPYIFEGEEITLDLWSRLRTDPRPIVLYGMGNGADKLIARLASIGREPSDFFASDSFVRGQSFHGKRVLSYSEMCARYPDPIILVSFATSLPEVMETICAMSERHSLYLPDMPVSGEDYFDLPFFLANKEAIRETAACLADDASRALLDSMLRYKLTGEIAYLLEGVNEDTSFLHPERYRTMLDGGAYTGDTASRALDLSPSLAEILAIEPDPKNYKRLARYAAGESRARITPLHAALGDRCGSVCFQVSGNRNATVGVGSYGARSEEVPSVTIDSLGFLPDYVKLDVEGEEHAALMGGVETLRRCRPELLVSLYHRSEDIFRLPPLVWELLGTCRLYLRRKPCFPAWELNLYAIC